MQKEEAGSFSERGKWPWLRIAAERGEKVDQARCGKADRSEASAKVGTMNL